MPEYHIDVPVRFNDIDMFGHVNSPVYLTYCEINRVSMFELLREETGSDLMNKGFVIAETRIRYLVPVTLADASVSVTCSVERLGRSSIQLSYSIDVGEVTAAEVQAVVVLVENGNSRHMSEIEREWFQTYNSASAS